MREPDHQISRGEACIPALAHPCCRTPDKALTMSDPFTLGIITALVSQNGCETTGGKCTWCDISINDMGGAGNSLEVLWFH